MEDAGAATEQHEEGHVEAKGGASVRGDRCSANGHGEAHAQRTKVSRLRGLERLFYIFDVSPAVSPNICEMQTFMNTLAYRRRIEEAERADLLSRSDANGGGGWRANMDDDAQAMGYVQNSKRALEEAFQTGTAILTNMAGQRERLKVSL